MEERSLYLELSEPAHEGLVSEEQAKLNGQSTTPTPAPTSTPKHP